jgi:hypothetical protein
MRDSLLPVGHAQGAVAKAAAIVPVPMSSQAARSEAPMPRRAMGRLLRVAFLGPKVWLDVCTPPSAGAGLEPKRFSLSRAHGVAETLAAIDAFRPDVCVVFDPPSVATESLGSLPGVALGILVDGVPSEPNGPALDHFDRLLTFAPTLTGVQVGAGEIWRAIPPTVSDVLFEGVRPLHDSPRAMSVGRSTPHREAMLMPAKHYHDLLQVIHGVSGTELGELLAEYDVGVYVADAPGGGFGQHVGLHLAAGHLLLAEPLTPTHGLEQDIDYLQFDSPEGLVWMLDRLARFPEMYQRVRVRGRLKAEQYRASRVFARVLHDLLADVSAFGPAPAV